MRIAPLMNFAETDPMPMALGEPLRLHYTKPLTEEEKKRAAILRFERKNFSNEGPAVQEEPAKAATAFKVGDKVRVLRLPLAEELWRKEMIPKGEMLHRWAPMLGKTSVVTNAREHTGCGTPAVAISGSSWVWPVSCLKLVEEAVVQEHTFKLGDLVRIKCAPTSDEVYSQKGIHSWEKQVGLEGIIERLTLTTTGVKAAIVNGLKHPLRCLELVSTEGNKPAKLADDW